MAGGVQLDAMLVRTPDVCGGRLRIDGTRVTVLQIASLYKQGESAEEIGQNFPHLSLGQVYAAYAARDGRAVYTFNAGDFSRLHGESMQQGQDHR